MPDLHLALKGGYSDAIRADTKTEEYRLYTPYWQKRLASLFSFYDRIALTRGYPRRNDESRWLELPWSGYHIKKITHPHVRIDPVTVYAFQVHTDNKEK